MRKKLTKVAALNQKYQSELHWSSTKIIELSDALQCASQRESLRDRAFENIEKALRDLLAMLDASSFGGKKTYRCLTEFEVARLAEIRKLVKP